MRLNNFNPFRAVETVAAHCDLFCGVYYPEQARIEAESVKACADKYHASQDDVFRARCISIKEERAEMTKHHLWVLWTDYFKPPHLEAHPELHEMFWKATKLAGDAKKSMDAQIGQDLLDAIDAISVIFWETKGGKPAWLTA
ncbi:MAG: nickel superoxide dismutase [Glaciecola sp.]|jgi:nickel superoxide dismutase